jgi:hypothetical protein
VRVRQDAQRRVYALEPGPLAELDAWLAPYRRLWDDRLNALERQAPRRDEGDGGLKVLHGTYRTVDGRPALGFERRVAHPIEAVRRAVTEPDALARWFPSRVTVDLRVGGAMSFGFGDGMTLAGEVTELDPPHRFAFSWGDDHVSFELEPKPPPTAGRTEEWSGHYEGYVGRGVSSGARVPGDDR